MTFSIGRSARNRLAYAAAIAATLAMLPLSASPAAAADNLAQPVPLAAAVPLWSGFYMGIQGGSGWGSSRLQDPGFGITYDPVTVSSTGWLAGAQIGGDWQFGSVVIGGELEASKASLSGSTAPTMFVLSGLSASYRALASGTARAGYAYGNFLGYAKAGVAWANVDYKSALGTQLQVEVDHQRTGLTAGAGLEFALLSNLSARLEYDYVYFGAAAINLGSRYSPSNVDHTLQLVKLGLNWRFSGDYLLARY
jgi:outer membrane immunogenic protein